MNTTITTIYGASDDLIELDGAIYDEFSAYDADSQLAFDNGAILTIRYDDDGIWRIENTNQHPGVALTRCEDRYGFTDRDGPVYSDLATVTGAEHIRGGYLWGKIYTLEAWAALTACNALVRELRRLGVELTGRAASLTSDDLRAIRDIAAKQPR